MTTTTLGGMDPQQHPDSVKSQKTIATINHIRKHNKTTESHSGRQLVGWNTMLLTSICTHKKLYPRPGQFNQTTIAQVPDPLINQVQVDVNIGLYGFLAESCDSSNVGMRRGC